MAIAGPLGLIVGLGAVLGAATSQVIPTRLVSVGDRPWGEVNPERYPEIVAVTYDSAPGIYFAPKAYTAVSPVIPVGPWDMLPADDYGSVASGDEHLDDAAWQEDAVASDDFEQSQSHEAAPGGDPMSDSSAPVAESAGSFSEVAQPAEAGV